MATTKIGPAKQEHHPDNPRGGWTVTVYDSKGLLYARFYGATKEQAERRAREFEEDHQTAIGVR